jgi:hypothetical protein
MLPRTTEIECPSMGGCGHSAFVIRAKNAIDYKT